ncbi:MAG: hypothetical protein ABIQ12_08945 [Opitutaceae bacterium]
MSEWISVIAVFWILWAIDGAKIAPRAIFPVTGGGWSRSAGVVFRRLSRPGGWPGSWRVTASDVPLALSAAGLCNRPVGGTGRPAEAPMQAQAWRWEEIRDAGVAKGWLFVNGKRFCPDTGHVSAPQLLALARLPAGDREKRIRLAMGRWFRPAHLIRRVRMLRGRTRLVARLNVILLLGCLLLSVFAAGVITSRLSDGSVERVGTILPWFLLGLVGAHFGAVIAAWRVVGRLKAVAPEKRRTGLLSALLMPPQAMRLRALLGEGFFPAQHPLAVVVALGSARARAAWAFNVIADLRWPIGGADDSELAREITGWFRTELTERIASLLRSANLEADSLLALPAADGLGSCSYCPRCRDQFVGGVLRCPHGVELQTLRR